MTRAERLNIAPARVTSPCASSTKCENCGAKTHTGHWKFGEVSVEIGERRDGDILILSPAGQIDNDPSAAFQATLLGALPPGAAVLVDFSSIEYVSSAGLRALMMGSK